jgi:hypothetical protein
VLTVWQPQPSAALPFAQALLGTLATAVPATVIVPS